MSTSVKLYHVFELLNRDDSFITSQIDREILEVLSILNLYIENSFETMLLINEDLRYEFELYLSKGKDEHYLLPENS